MPTERITYFIDVILPVAVPNLFTYRVPFELNEKIKIGQRVVVQFGKSKMYSALVRKIHEIPPKQYQAKFIESILDTSPIVNEKQFKLWEWVSSYYMCTIGEVMNAALPSGLKLSSETKLLLCEISDELKANLSDNEFIIVEALETREVLSIEDVAEILQKKHVHSVIKSLIEKKVILIHEEIKEKFKPKIESFVILTENASKEENLKTILNSLEKKAYKQMELLMSYLKLTQYLPGKVSEIKKTELLKSVDANDATLQSLVKKNVFQIKEKETGRLTEKNSDNSAISLSYDQENIFQSIKKQFESKDVVLLHGVTSSGKTEVYIRLIEEAINEGKQVLYLLPEIALTAQIINRLRKIFGAKVGVYHSRFNESERVEVWNSVLGTQSQSTNPKYDIILGARSALFLPFDNLGLVIVDEEHDTSYKQFDPAPRYNARDSASYLAHLHRAKTLLGSATPAVESYFNSQDEKYGFAELITRFGGVQMPEILVGDLKEARKRKQMKQDFSPLLLESIETALVNKEQIILFQNRRGFAPMQTCEQCAWAAQCVNCDVTLTYHKHQNLLRCHYCGYSLLPPSKCAACGHDVLKLVGFGTEKIEEDLQLIFPNAKTVRMDLDSTRGKHAHTQIISDFENLNIDILVGTQMVTKGLDFDNVSVVGILNADSMLNFPDFRAFEKSFQLMAQVSGRAGRKSKRGKVIIQTTMPTHSVIQQVTSHNYLQMYQDEIRERKSFHYPPFYRLIELTLSHKEADELNDAADFFTQELKKKLNKRVIGPGFPLVSRVKNKYLKNILVKIEKESSVNSVKDIISDCISLLHNHTHHKSVRVQADVDPM